MGRAVCNVRVPVQQSLPCGPFCTLCYKQRSRGGADPRSRGSMPWNPHPSHPTSKVGGGPNHVPLLYFLSGLRYKLARFLGTCEGLEARTRAVRLGSTVWLLAAGITVETQMPTWVFLVGPHITRVVAICSADPFAVETPGVMHPSTRGPIPTTTSLLLTPAFHHSRPRSVGPGLRCLLSVILC